MSDLKFTSTRPFTLSGVTPEQRDEFLTALGAAIKRKLETAKGEFSADEIADEFIEEHGIFSDSEVWTHVGADLARHALADYIDLCLMNNPPGAEEMETFIAKHKPDPEK